jgi:hypothetical protein
MSIGGIYMDKDKLIKAIQEQKSNEDEREKNVRSISFHWGQMGGMIALLLIIIIRFISGELFSQDLLMIVMGQTSISSFYQYKQLKENKTYLFFGILAMIAFILSLYNTLLYYEIIHF